MLDELVIVELLLSVCGCRVVDGVSRLNRAVLLLIELCDRWSFPWSVSVSRIGLGPAIIELLQTRFVTFWTRTLLERGRIGLDCVARIELPADSKLDTEKRDGLLVSMLRLRS